MDYSLFIQEHQYFESEISQYGLSPPPSAQVPK